MLAGTMHAEMMQDWTMKAETLTIALPDEAATARLGEDLAAALRVGDLVALSGDLGAGKTALARAMIRALAGSRDLDVPSPTFTLVQTYMARIPVAHFDLFRIAGPDEVDELGLTEALETGVAIVEWPEKAGTQLPDGAIRIRLDHCDVGRVASIEAPEPALARIARSLDIRDFLDRSGLGSARRTFLQGDASTRTYETIVADGRDPAVLMNAPKQPDGPPIRGGKPYSQIAHLAESVTAFVAMARALKARGVTAPAIQAQDLDHGLVLIEHLGSTGVLDAAGAPIPARYIAAAELLADMHVKAWPDRMEAEPGVFHHVPPYDRGAMTIETELLIDWYIPYATGIPVLPAVREAYATAWRKTFDRLADAETSIVLRDYHSPNLIWRAVRRGHDRLGVIDFQDAVIGPSAYDVASLAMDARVTVPKALERAIVEAYCARRLKTEGFDRRGFEAAYAIMAAQRNSKILGIFVRLNERDGKPHYLKHLPRIRDYLTRALAHPALAEVAEFHAAAGLFDAAA
jgi:N-acetylmuramate 1-kinase